MSGPRQNPVESIRRFLQQPKGHVHMVGVCGVGMAGVAFLLKTRGFKVTGCDAHLNPLADWLEQRGIKVSQGHDPAHVAPSPRPSPSRGEGGGRVDWIVRTPAVAEDSPEIVAARKAGVPLFFRGETLPALLADRVSVAVCGTHGKTTTSTFITQMLRSSGRDPSWCIGGENPGLGGVAGVGKGSVIVVEADESDGTLALYQPDIAVVTNIEFDHMEHFESVKAFENCFRTFIHNARRKVVYCAEDPRAAALCKGSPMAVSYGLGSGAAVRGTGLKLSGSSVTFTLERSGKRLGTVTVPAPGRHNALNALAAAAVGLELGLSVGEICRALQTASLPRRRFEKIVDKDGVLVISDYAHHPSEIRALVRAALKLKHKRLLAVYQPHRYTRTLALGMDFPPAFAGVDELVLCPVYAASERPLKGGTIWDLYRHFRGQRTEVRSQKSEERTPVVSVATSLEQAWGYYRHQLKRGDVFLVVGAGDVEKIAGWAREEIEVGGHPPPPRLRRTGMSEVRQLPMPKLTGGTLVRLDEPLAGKTTMRVGGKADVWVDVGAFKGLVRLLKWTFRHGVPFHVLGAGSNVVVSDLGVRGIVARLTGKDFRTIREEKGCVCVGVGVPLARLVGWMQARGEGGYEFLEGIPGVVGGAVRMNAGAWGYEIGPLVESIRCLNSDGSECVIAGKKLMFEYRRCPPLESRVALEVTLRAGASADVDDIRRHRADMAKKRRWWKGLHCAGSVFKNPPGRFAGRLIEQAGLKGVRVGGARVSPKHANVIVTDEGALASDVRCLIETIRCEVEHRSGIRMETEIVFLE